MKQPINEIIRLQQLAGIISEAEANTADAKIKADNALTDLLRKIKSSSKNVKPSSQDASLEEAVLTLGALVVGAPGLLELLGDGADAIGQYFSNGFVGKTKIGDWLKSSGRKLEHNYIDSIGGYLQFAFPKKFKGQNPNDSKSDLHTKAHGIYAALLLAAAASSASEAGKAVGLVTKSLEGGAAAFKTAEVVQLAQKIAQA